MEGTEQQQECSPKRRHPEATGATLVGTRRVRTVSRNVDATGELTDKQFQAEDRMAFRKEIQEMFSRGREGDRERKWVVRDTEGNGSRDKLWRAR